MAENHEKRGSLTFIMAVDTLIDTFQLFHIYVTSTDSKTRGRESGVGDTLLVTNFW